MTQLDLASLAPGPRNLITDVAGIAVGNADDPVRWTGTTVVTATPAALGAVDVRGGAPGTRETALLDPTCRVDEVHAIVLSGGSVFGLEAASTVARLLAARGVGLLVRSVKVPIVPAAILFDLLNGGDKDWGERPPYDALGRAALDAAGPDFALGTAGAGYGAKAGRLKGGLGSASAVTRDGLEVGALVAANPRGSVVMPGSARFWATPFALGDELGVPAALRAGPNRAASDLDLLDLPTSEVAANTTIGVVATNAILTKAEAQRVAIMAQDGYARAIRPVHTPFDGDVVFVLSTQRHALPEPAAAAIGVLGSIAADCLARATARGVFEATALGPWPAYRDWRRSIG